MTQRICGGCTACCTTHAIEEIGKLAGLPCPHCNEGNGCKIYKKRPQSCRDFQCGWLLGRGRAEDRPNLSGIVIDTVKFSPTMSVTGLFEVWSGALQGSFAQQERQDSFELGVPVLHIPISGSVELRVPSKFMGLPIFSHAPSVNGRQMKITYAPIDAK